MHASVESMVNVQVKRVPEQWHATLKARATARGISLNDLLLELLERETSLPTLDEWNQRATHLAARIAAAPEVLSTIRDETFWDDVKGRGPE